MYDMFYGPNDYYYLSHHGILGQKWGKQNGPPYPLSDAKHDRVVQRRAERAARKAERRRNKILSDPKKLYKHRSEFTTEEMVEALNKIKVAESVRRQAHPSKRKVKPVKLSGKQKKWAENVNTLSKHANKYTPEQFELAKQILDNKNYLFEQKMTAAEKPKRIIALGTDYLVKIAGGVAGYKKLADVTASLDPNKLTRDERHKEALLKSGKTALSSDMNWVNNLNTISKNKLLQEDIFAYRSDLKKKQKIMDDASTGNMKRIQEALTTGDWTGLKLADQELMNKMNNTKEGRTILDSWSSQGMPKEKSAMEKIAAAYRSGNYKKLSSKEIEQIKSLEKSDEGRAILESFKMKNKNYTPETKESSTSKIEKAVKSKDYSSLNNNDWDTIRKMESTTNGRDQLKKWAEPEKKSTGLNEIKTSGKTRTRKQELNSLNKIASEAIKEYMQEANAETLKRRTGGYVIKDGASVEIKVPGEEIKLNELFNDPEYMEGLAYYTRMQQDWYK